MSRPVEHKPEKILAAARSLFHREGVHVSTAKIAAAAGVSNGTLFNHFGTKQDLIDALYVSIKTDLANALGEIDRSEPLARQARTVWDRWLDWARANEEAHAVMNLLHQSGLASESARQAAMEAVQTPMQLLTDAEAAGLLVDLPLPYLGALVQHQLDQAVVGRLDPEQADVAFLVLWNGITRPEHHGRPEPATT